MRKPHQGKHGEQSAGTTKRQRASALFTALALLVMAASIVTMLITIQRVSIRRTEALLQTDASYYHNQAVEAWAIDQIKQWHINDDHFHPAPVAYPEKIIPGGRVRGSIEDWQSKYNILQLRLSSNNEIFKNLLKSLLNDINNETATVITENIQQRLRSLPAPEMLSELRLIDEITAKRYEALLPHLALLQSANIHLNINSISGKLFVAMIPELTEADIKTFEEFRQEKKGITNINDLKNIFPDKDIPTSLFSLKSNFYLVTSEVIQDDYRIKIYSLINILGDRENLSMNIQWRSWNTL